MLAGAIDTTAHRVIDQARRAVASVCQGYRGHLPFYALNDAEEIKAHFRAIAAIDVPVFAYDVPVRLGAKLGLGPACRTGQEGVIAGVKDSSGNDVAFRRLVAANEAAGHRWRLTGHECVVDGMLLWALTDSSPATAMWTRSATPRCGRASRRRVEKVRRIQDEICAGFEIVFVPQGRSADATGIGAFKTAMEAIGIIATNEMAFPVRRSRARPDAVLEIVRAQGLI